MYLFKTFKGFGDARLSLDEPVTLVIGRNGSGKSNAIEGIQLLGELATGRPLHEIRDLGSSGGFEIRGGLRGCCKDETDRFTLGYTSAFEGEELDYGITVVGRPEARVSREWLRVSDRTLFEVVSDDPASRQVLARWDNFRQGGNRPHQQFPADVSLLSRYGLAFAQDHSQERGQRAVEWLRSALRPPLVFDPQPRAMRRPAQEGAAILGRDGSNLAAVLFELHEGEAEGKATLGRILKAICQLPEEAYDDFSFLKGDSHQISLGFKRQTGPDVFTPLLSDGTLRTLALLTALEAPLPPRLAPLRHEALVVIEEIDNGLHPSRAKLLVAAMREAANRHGMRVLCTTHNPALLDALDPDQLRAVFVCHWSELGRSSDISRLLELPGADFLRERGSLGTLVTNGLLDQHLRPDFEGERKRRLTEWLESLPEPP